MMSMQKSLTAIKKYILEWCDIILLAKTNSFIKGAIYIAQIQKDIDDGKPLFRRCINLGIGL
jgi:hypothetical protein